MTVYEAVTAKDYRKIVAFIGKQPLSSLPMVCWIKGFKGTGLTLRHFEFWKTQIPYLHIFWCEDEKRVIRCVLSVQERMTPQQIPIATYASVILKDDDWKADNGAYFKELLDHIIRNEAPKYKLERGEFFGVEKFADWTKELCGDAMKIVNKFENELGIVYSYVIDFKRYLEITS